MGSFRCPYYIISLHSVFFFFFLIYPLLCEIWSIDSETKMPMPLHCISHTPTLLCQKYFMFENKKLRAFFSLPKYKFTMVLFFLTQHDKLNGHKKAFHGYMVHLNPTFLAQTSIKICGRCRGLPQLSD